MTIYDISEKAGVSIATVSRVLNGSRNVSEKTRKKVLDVIEHCGYTPNAFARGLGLNTMRTIGIMCADSSDPYLAKAVYHIEQNLRINGYDSLLCCTGYTPETKAASMNLLRTKKVDAIILVGSNFVHKKASENEYIAEASAHIPVMLLNAELDIPNVYSVAPDYYTAIYNATLEMFHNGIEDLLYFYNSCSYSGIRKLTGFLDACKTLALSVPAFSDQNIASESGNTQKQVTAISNKSRKNSVMTRFYQGSHEDIHAMTACLQQLHDSSGDFLFHGIIAEDDCLALAAVKYAKQMNYRIPEDFAVVGFNNSMLTVCCDPELTSIDNKLETLCRHLITTLLGVLEGKKMPQKTIFTGEIIRRGTTR